MPIDLKFKTVGSETPPNPTRTAIPKSDARTQQRTVWDIPERGGSPALLLEGASTGLLEAPEGGAMLICAHAR